MKQYLLSVHAYDVSGEVNPMPDPETMEQMFAAVDAFNTELQEKGAWVFAGGLEGPQTATVVREQDGQIVTTDGPYPEAKEYLGGFWVIKAADDAAAQEWAAKATRACQGPVEVRPFQDEAEE